MQTFGIAPQIVYKCKNGNFLHITNVKNEETSHYFIEQSGIKSNWFEDLLPKREMEDIGIVFIDPPYGLEVASWDKYAWKSEEIDRALNPLFSITSELYIVFFLSEEMIVDVITTVPSDYFVKYFYWYKVSTTCL